MGKAFFADEDVPKYKAELEEYLKQGYKMYMVAKKWGCTTQTVCRYAKLWRVTYDGKEGRVGPDFAKLIPDKDLIRELRQGGMLINVLAKKFDVQHHTMNRFLEVNEIEIGQVLPFIKLTFHEVIRASGKLDPKENYWVHNKRGDNWALISAEEFNRLKKAAGEI